MGHPILVQKRSPSSLRLLQANKQNNKRNVKRDCEAYFHASNDAYSVCMCFAYPYHYLA